VPITADLLPLADTATPADQAELLSTLREALAAGTPIYTIGGGTALEYGVTPRQQGLGLRLEKLNRVIDYPARDMTITVEAGITLAELARTLAAERQRLAVEAAQADRATLGGLVATNFSGPRRYGLGTVRDYVIGIAAVDGHGTAFKAGGRVVKNVAGYDFCKLLVGSLGTLAVITQVTLKLRPIPEASGLLVCTPANLEQVEQLLAALVTTRTAPVAVEWLLGDDWSELPGGAAPAGRLVIGYEGTRVEVEWMIGQLRNEWSSLGVQRIEAIAGEAAGALWSRLVEFPAAGEGLVLKAAVKPSLLLRFVDQALRVDPEASIQAHAANGVAIVRCPGMKPVDIGRTLVQRLQPATASAGGSLVVCRAPDGADLTRQVVWGGARSDHVMMRAVKQQFDPRGLLNPGRFVY
jgi:glycolate oxidase FAD binding subunit